jgi:tryptophan-rich sensory protein
MKNLPKLIVAVVCCELIGILGSVFTLSAISTWYSTLRKPFFAPPNWIFGPVWTLLYFLMGISFYLIWQQRSQNKKVRMAEISFLVQLGLNFIWTPIFFGLRSPLLGLIVIVIMWTIIVVTIQKFYQLSKWSAYLLIPYLVWVSFASVLNATIVILN